MSLQLPIFNIIANSNLNVLNIELIKIILDYYSFADTFDKKLVGHTKKITCITNLPNGDIITGSADKKIKIWNSDTGRLAGKCIKTLHGHQNGILCVNVLLDGRIISGSLDNTLKIWNPVNGKCEFTSKKRKYSFSHSSYYSVGQIDVTKNGMIFVCLQSEYSDSRIETFSLETYNYEKHVCNIDQIENDYVVIPSNGKVVIYSRTGKLCDSNNIYVLENCFNESNQALLWKKQDKGPYKTILHMAVLTDEYVVDFSDDCTLNFWNIETKQHILTKSLDYNGNVDIFFSHDLIVLLNGMIIVKFNRTVKIVKINIIKNDKINCDIIKKVKFGKSTSNFFALPNCLVATTSVATYFDQDSDDYTVKIWK